MEALRGREPLHWPQQRLGAKVPGGLAGRAFCGLAVCRGATHAQSEQHAEIRTSGFNTANRYILHVDPQMAGYKPEQLGSSSIVSCATISRQFRA